MFFLAYALTIFCVRVIQWSGHAKKEVSVMVDNQPLLHQYVTDDAFRLKISLYLSFVVNTLYAVLKFLYGFYWKSVWFGTLAVYYFLLAIMRLALLRYLVRSEFHTNRQKEWKWYQFCGAV